MDVAREDLLAGAGFADYENRAAARRDSAGEIDEAPGARRARDRIGFGAPRARLVAGGARQRCFVSLEHPTSHVRGRFVVEEGAKGVPGANRRESVNAVTLAAGICR